MGIITTAFVKQFGSNVEQLVQQKGSRLRGAVRIESGITGEEAFFDQLGATAAVQKTSRNADTPLIKSDHQRRRVSMFDYEWADLVDKEDRLKMLIDPESSYATSAAWALGRAIDDSIIASASGSAATGKAGGTSVPLPGGQKIVAGAAGLTIAKLIEAKEIMDLADVDPDEEKYICVAPKQMSDLLATTEVTSADYNTVRALVMGKIDTYMGFKFIISNRLATDGSDDRLVLAWARNGLLLGIAADIRSEIERRADKSYATQVYLSMGIGSTRMEEEKLVEIACVEA
jgi:hypothetical protein